MVANDWAACFIVCLDIGLIPLKANTVNNFICLTFQQLIHTSGLCHTYIYKLEIKEPFTYRENRRWISLFLMSLGNMLSGMEFIGKKNLMNNETEIIFPFDYLLYSVSFPCLLVRSYCRLFGKKFFRNLETYQDFKK